MSKWGVVFNLKSIFQTILGAKNSKATKIYTIAKPTKRTKNTLNELNLYSCLFPFSYKHKNIPKKTKENCTCLFFLLGHFVYRLPTNK